jgi:hypothetical protein
MLPTTPPAPSDLNDRLDAFVEEYNNREHSSIKESPYERYRNDLSCVRPSPERLLDYFRRREYRRVKKDRTVQISNKAFEVPTSLIDKTVELFFHDDASDDVEIFHQGITYGRAVLLNQVVNARIGRDWGGDGQPKKEVKGEKVPLVLTRQESHGGRLFDAIAYGPSEVDV